MNAAPIHFQFDQAKQAQLALDTLEELGYRADLHEGGGKPIVHLILDECDLTSALEIAQAYGGKLIEHEDAPSEAATYDMAYGLGGIAIPAHVVNEDWPEGYADSEVYNAAAQTTPYQEEDGRMDPSNDDYDHFSAGIRM
ncbi:hypothetical protein [Paenibacillus hamazuiensis]|uniref:hypothetical protein n=1 Tax=Paenibacillus hamazuiensis TaxID=2936508 RepID=UPI00200F2B51|nr:hypothetical protein [Paenibacillus hamazuiensis]